MKKLMVCAMFAMAFCCGSQAVAQSVNGITGATQKMQNDKQRPQPNGDFCPCPCCRKDMQKNDKSGQKNFNDMRPNGQQGQMQGHGMPPQGMQQQGGQGNRPPQGMQATQCKCGKKCTKCDCNKSSSKKSKKNKKNKSNN